MPVFFSDEDRHAYLAFLATGARRFGLEVWAWCLMTNHVHLLVVPQDADSLARGLGDAHRRYTRMVNLREAVRGHLFQERFRSYAVPRDAHAVAVGRYIELNPVKAGLVARAEDYAWSSARYNVADSEVDPLVFKRALGKLAAPWAEVLRDGEKDAERRRIELHSGTGRPMGEEKWVRGLERRLERKLLALPAGWQKGRRRRESRGNEDAKRRA